MNISQVGTISRKVKAAAAVVVAASGVGLAAPAGAETGSGVGNLKAVGSGAAIVGGEFSAGTVKGSGVLVVMDPDHDLEVTVTGYGEKREGGAFTFYLGWNGEVTIGEGNAIIGVLSPGVGLDITGEGRFHLEGRGFWDTEPGGEGVWGTRRRPSVGQI